MPPFLALFFTKKEQNLWCQVTKICQILLMVSLTYGQGSMQEGKTKGIQLSSHQTISKMFSMNRPTFFFIISNLCDSYEPYALST